MSSDASRTESSWEELKDQGNGHYKKSNYSDAIDQYTKAIDLLKISDDDNNNEKVAASTPKDREELAKLFSNRSLCRFKLSEGKKDSGKSANLEKALEDGKTAVEINDKFDKSYYRCGYALCALDRKDEAVKYADTIINLYKTSGKDYKHDSVLNSFLRECNYQPDNITEYKSLPIWERVKHKGNVRVISPKDSAKNTKNSGGKILDSKKMTLIMKPGTYQVHRINWSLVIGSDQDVQILGDIRKPSDKVILQCQGSQFDLCSCHLIHVQGGQLTVSDVHLRQMSLHPEVHALWAATGSTVTMESCHITSKCSGAVAATDGSKLSIKNCTFDGACGGTIAVSGAQINIDKCTFTNMIKIGVETRDRGYTDMQDSTLTNCGSQALVTHAWAKGCKVDRCTFKNNSRSVRGEASVTCGAGTTQLTECAFINNQGGGVMAQQGGDAVITRCTFTGGRHALGASMKGTAVMKDCTISNVVFGACVLFNQNGKIVLDGNKMSNIMDVDVMITEADTDPEILRGEHRVRRGQSNPGHLKGEILKKIDQQKRDHFGNAMPWTDPTLCNPHDERLCHPCGMSQRTVGRPFMMCAGCKLSWYCSKDCQRKDWKLHKADCKRTQEMLKK